MNKNPRFLSTSLQISHSASTRPTTYVIFKSFYVHCINIDWSASFRIFICSEYQWDFFCLQLIEKRLSAPNADLKKDNTVELQWLEH